MIGLAPARWAPNARIALVLRPLMNFSGRMEPLQPCKDLAQNTDCKTAAFCDPGAADLARRDHFGSAWSLRLLNVRMLRPVENVSDPPSSPASLTKGIPRTEVPERLAGVVPQE